MLSVPDVSQAHIAFNFSRSSLNHPSKGTSPNTSQPLYSNHTSHYTHGHYATRVGRKQERKRRNCSSYLSHVAALLVGAMRHRSKIGRRFARGNRPDRKKSRTGGRGAREYAASTNQHQCGEIFGGLQNSNSSAFSVGVLLLPRRTGDDTHTRHAARLRPARFLLVVVVSQSSSLLYSNTV